jgi:hypothetical protein
MINRDTGHEHGRYPYLSSMYQATIFLMWYDEKRARGAGYLFPSRTKTENGKERSGVHSSPR